MVEQKETREKVDIILNKLNQNNMGSKPEKFLNLNFKNISEFEDLNKILELDLDSCDSLVS